MISNYLKTYKNTNFLLIISFIIILLCAPIYEGHYKPIKKDLNDYEHIAKASFWLRDYTTGSIISRPNHIQGKISGFTGVQVSGSILYLDKRNFESFNFKFNTSLLLENKKSFLEIEGGYPHEGITSIPSKIIAYNKHSLADKYGLNFFILQQNENISRYIFIKFIQENRYCVYEDYLLNIYYYDVGFKYL